MSICQLSIVIPAFNEAKSLPLMLARLENILQPLGLSYEIVVVDDGSTDNTFEVLQRLQKDVPTLSAVRFSRQFGKEAGLLAGLQRTQGESVITLDADLQHPPEYIPEFIKLWQEGHQLVYGVKREREDGWLRQKFANVFNRLFSKMAGFDLTRSSDFMLLDRRLVNMLVQDFPERGRFYRGLSRWLGFDAALVEFDVAPREVGETNWSPFALFQYALNSITRYSQIPLQMVTFLGLITLLITFILGIEVLYSKWMGVSVSGFATLEITLLFLGSMIMIGLGIIGQYLSHIYEEIKQRPLFIVAATLEKAKGTDK